MEVIKSDVQPSGRRPIVGAFTESLLIIIGVVGLVIGLVVATRAIKSRVESTLNQHATVAARHHYRLIQYREGDWWSDNEVKLMYCDFDNSGHVKNCAVLVEIP